MHPLNNTNVFINKIKIWRTLVIAIAAVVMILRTPYLFLSSRFWAEEGSLYFSEAFHSTWHKALLAGHQGYYSFFPNVTTLMAALIVPLENAPFVTTFAAFLIQLLVVFIILYRLQSVFTPIQQLLLCVATIFVCNTGEIWLNTITTQFHLCLASFFIIMSNQQKVSKSWVIFDRVVLILSGLTGVVTSFLLPVLLIRWFIERSRNLLMLSLTLLSTTFLQIIYILSHGLIGNRLEVENSVSFTESSVRLYVLTPIFEDNTNFLVNYSFYLYLLAGSIVMLSLSILFESKHIELKLAVISFLSVSILSLLGSLGMGGGARYAYVPGVILMILFILNLKLGENKFMKVCSAVIIAIAFLSWIPSYSSSLSPWILKNEVVWSEEVSKWRKNNNYLLKISPQWEKDRWNIRLKNDKTEQK